VKPQHLAGWAALLLIVVAGVLAFLPVHANGVNCGSVVAKTDNAIKADFAAALQADNSFQTLADPGHFTAACSDGRSSRRTLTFALGIPGLVLAVAGFGVATVATNRTRQE
jgi:hypothetical protein